jgi:hypothetical protein
VGRAEEEIADRMPSTAHAAHYRRWASRFERAVRGSISFVPGEIVHLWHGDIRDRQYRVRFEGFDRFDFDPERDIALDDQEAWRWASRKPRLHARALELFSLRREDGPAP